MPSDLIFREDAKDYARHAMAKGLNVLEYLDEVPAADFRPVVLCGACELHGHCYTEDVFAFALLAEENRFCAVGKVKTDGKKREES